jgi:hypothetical protein
MRFNGLRRQAAGSRGVETLLKIAALRKGVKLRLKLG